MPDCGYRLTETALGLGLAVGLFARFEHEFRYDHFPGIAFDTVLILRIRRFAAPLDDGQHRTAPAAHPGWRLEAPCETSHHRARAIQQFPTPALYGAYLQPISRRQRGDRTMDSMMGRLASGEAEIHPLKTSPDVAVLKLI